MRIMNRFEKQDVSHMAQLLAQVVNRHFLGRVFVQLVRGAGDVVIDNSLNDERQRGLLTPGLLSGELAVAFTRIIACCLTAITTRPSWGVFYKLHHECFPYW